MRLRKPQAITRGLSPETGDPYPEVLRGQELLARYQEFVVDKEVAVGRAHREPQMSPHTFDLGTDGQVDFDGNLADEVNRRRRVGLMRGAVVHSPIVPSALATIRKSTTLASHCLQGWPSP